MDRKEHVTNIMGFLVVAHEEGLQLGNVHRIFIDPEVGRIASLTFRPGTLAKLDFVNAENIERIGQDVVLITGKKAVRDFTDKTTPPGRDLKELLGTWVTTLDGEHLGTLVDLDVSPDTWEITDLWLSDGGRLKVQVADLKIGKDEILVPVEYAKKVVRETTPRSGVLSRMLGSTTIDDLAASIRRALRPTDKGEKVTKKTTKKTAKQTTKQTPKKRPAAG